MKRWRALSVPYEGTSSDPIYGRLSNPTNSVLEKRLALLENGTAALVTSSGMAAIANTCLSLLGQGDEFIASKNIFMTTHFLFQEVMKKYGITVHFLDMIDSGTLESAINEHTKFIYTETINIPSMDVNDLSALSSLAHSYGLPLIVDNTCASPFLANPLSHGADIVIHSTTKYISGHGHVIGGCIIDGGRFNWDQEKFVDLAPYLQSETPSPILKKVWHEQHITVGTTPSPMSSYLTLVGLETLSVRMERALKNSLDLVEHQRGQCNLILHCLNFSKSSYTDPFDLKPG